MVLEAHRDREMTKQCMFELSEGFLERMRHHNTVGRHFGTQLEAGY